MELCVALGLPEAGGGDFCDDCPPSTEEVQEGVTIICVDTDKIDSDSGCGNYGCCW